MPAGAAIRKSVYDSSEELDLVHRAKRGDETAFDSLFKAHHNRVVLTVTKFLKDGDDAEWVANNALWKVWRGLPSFKEQSKFSTWITRIAINEAQMYLRSGKRKQREVSLDSMLSFKSAARSADCRVFSDDQSNAGYAQKWLAIRDLELEGIADRQLLERALGKVPERFREILRFRLWEGLSLEEIQAKVNAEEPNKLVSISAVKSRLLRARTLLIAEIEQIS
jgi:RNA polymerase sigma-70 factor, ECF subfamily